MQPGPGETLDALAGHWRLFQLKDGHRYSTDDLLAAWFAVDTLERLGRSPVNALDLGTGIGSVALFLLWSFPGLHVTAIEAQAESLALARRSARYNGVEDRVRFVSGDLRQGVPLPGSYDLITGSPPYWDSSDGTVSEAPQKGPCRFELRGGLESYCQAAERALAVGGLFCVVFDGRQAERIEQAARKNGLTIVRYLPVVSRAGDPPLIALAAMRRSAEGPHGRLDFEPLVLRDAEGKRPPAFRALRARMGMPPGPL